MTLFLSSLAAENVVSRDRFGGPVPRQPVAHSPHSRLNVALTYGIPPHTVLLLVRRANCPSILQQSHVLAYGRNVQFISFILGFNRPRGQLVCSKKTLNASRPSEHPSVRGKISKRLGGIIDCKDNTSSWHLNGFPYGSGIGSTVCVV